MTIQALKINHIGNDLETTTLRVLSNKKIVGGSLQSLSSCHIELFPVVHKAWKIVFVPIPFVASPDLA